MKLSAGDQQFYQLYFLEPGRAKVELETDFKKTMRMFLYSISGNAPPEKCWRPFFDRTKKIFDTVFEPYVLPKWLAEKHTDYYAAEFRRTGFRGGLI